MRRRWRYRLLGVGILWAVLSSAFCFGGEPEDEVILNGPNDLHSLRDLLDDSETFSRLAELVQCLPLWRITTRETGSEAAYVHLFDFATPRRQTTRVYRAAFATHADGTSAVYKAENRGESYATAPLGYSRPMASSEMELKVLQLALSEPEIYDTVSSHLDGFDEVNQIAVRPASEYGAVTVDPETERVVGFHFGGLEGGPETVSLYWKVSFDPDSHIASFSKWIGD